MTRPRFSLSFAFLASTLIGVGLGQYGRLRIEQAEYRRQALEVDRVLESCRAAACDFAWNELPGYPRRFAIVLQGSVTPSLAKAIVGSEVIERVELNDPLGQEATHELANGFHPLPGKKAWVRNNTQ